MKENGFIEEKESELIQEIKDVTYVYMGIKITDKQASEILDEYPSIRKFGADDTEERSNIINHVCMDICNMKVPTYGDSQEYGNKFKKAIIENASLKGYELSKEEWNEQENY